MKSIILLLVGLLIGVALTVTLPVLAQEESPYGVFPRTGLQGERYDPGTNTEHFRDGQWFFGPSRPTRPFQTTPC